MSQRIITSADNPHFRGLRKLASSRRERRKAGLTLLDGVHLVEAYRKHVGLPEQLIVNAAGRTLPGVAELIAELPSGAVIELADGLFRELSTVDTPTGLLAVIRPPQPGRPAGRSNPCVFLEDIQDPGNLGSILRSAAAAGIGEVHLTGHSADAWSPRVLRAGMGAHFLLTIREAVEPAAFTAAFAGRIVATHHHATQSVFATDLTGDICLVFGNEGAGLSRHLLDAADSVVAIPMPGSTESLNIAAAAAVCLFERVRQLGGDGFSSRIHP